MNEVGSRVLHCDANCVVVNKIAGEACEGAGEGMAPLPDLLAAELAAPCRAPPSARDPLPAPVAVNRLDVPVSGCALFARGRAALSFLNDAFVKGAVEKRYWAIVERPRNDSAHPRFPENALSQGFEAVHWTRFDRRRNKAVAHGESGPGRKKAILRCRLVGEGRDYLFMEIDLVTGRRHQIRAQLERLGLRVKGDLKYGARRSEKSGGIRLHARSLSFPAPDAQSGGAGRISAIAEPPFWDGLWRAFWEAKIRADEAN